MLTEITEALVAGGFQLQRQQQVAHWQLADAAQLAPIVEGLMRARGLVCSSHVVAPYTGALVVVATHVACGGMVAVAINPSCCSAHVTDRVVEGLLTAWRCAACTPAWS